MKMVILISIIALIISLVALCLSYKAYQCVPKISFNKDMSKGQIILPEGSIRNVDGSFYEPLTDEELKRGLNIMEREQVNKKNKKEKVK